MTASAIVTFIVAAWFIYSGIRAKHHGHNIVGPTYVLIGLAWLVASLWFATS